MAELYPPGIQRIYYKAVKEGDLNITAKILDPHLETENYYVFTKVPGTQKIYFSDVDFYEEGIWIAVFYENGNESTVQAYNTKKIPAEGEFKIRGGYRGPSVIN